MAVSTTTDEKRGTQPHVRVGARVGLPFGSDVREAEIVGVRGSGRDRIVQVALVSDGEVEDSSFDVPAAWLRPL